jgi:hypothetical protein
VRTGSFALLAAGCASILDIDGHYLGLAKGSGGSVAHEPDAEAPSVDAAIIDGATHGEGGVLTTGGAPTGGVVTSAGGAVSGAGGTMNTGGAASGGVTGTGGADCMHAGACETGQKCCGSKTTTATACYVPAPLVGCGETGCDPCADAVPANATAICDTGKCSFKCNPGYTDKSGACTATGTGGAGAGGTGAGGRGATTACNDDKDCPTGCGPAGIFGCCLSSGMCGCTYLNIEIGGQINIGYCLPRPPVILPPR